MQNINIQLKAGVALQSQVKGLLLQVIGTDGAENLSVQFIQGSGVAYTVNGVAAGWRLKPTGGFDSVVFQSDNDAAITCIVTSGDIDVQVLEVGSTITNAANNPVPVSIVSEPGQPFAVTIAEGSTVEVTADNVGINNTEANPVPVKLVASDDATGVPVLPVLAQTPATVAPVVVAANANGVVLIAADATRRAARFYNPNISAGPVAITPDLTTSFASASVVLYPGDFWSETDAPGAAWYASTPNETGATVNLQTVNA